MVLSTLWTEWTMNTLWIEWLELLVNSTKDMQEALPPDGEMSNKFSHIKFAKNSVP